MLKFGKGNAKLGKSVHTFSLLSGHTCPYADKCLSKVQPKGNTLTVIDGPNTEFRCFSASQEALYPRVYKARKQNTDMLRALRSKKAMVELIIRSLPKNAKIIRIHVAGDFFSQTYFDAWIEVAKQNPAILFYAYTKAIPFWMKRQKEVDSLHNFVLTASEGGKKDSLIEKLKLRKARVVLSEDTLLPIDHDDSLARNRNVKEFALLIHGVQPKGTKAAKALASLRKEGKGGYRRK